MCFYPLALSIDRLLIPRVCPLLAGALGGDMLTLELVAPNLVVEILPQTSHRWSGEARRGTFTMTYDQGMEIRYFLSSHSLCVC